MKKKSLTNRIIDEFMLYLYYHRGMRIILKNSFLLGDYEMDVACLNRNDFLYEYEVKISRSDFLADMKKRTTSWNWHTMKKNPDKLKHDQYKEGEGPKYFYYICPEGLIQPTEIPAKYGLYYYDVKADHYGGAFKIIRKARALPCKPVDNDIMRRLVVRLSARNMNVISKEYYSQRES